MIPLYWCLIPVSPYRLGPSRFWVLGVCTASLRLSLSLLLSLSLSSSVSLSLFLSLTPSLALLYLSVARLVRKGRQLSLEESETAQLSLSSLSLSLLSLSLLVASLFRLALVEIVVRSCSVSRRRVGTGPTRILYSCPNFSTPFAWGPSLDSACRFWCRCFP